MTERTSIVFSVFRRRSTIVVTSLAAVIALSTVTACTASLEADQPSHPPTQLQSDLDVLTSLGISGAQTQVVKADGSQHLATSGVATLGTQQPFPRNGHFRMGSTTKTFTATVVLQLVSEGKLSLEDTVEKWLPGVVQGNGNDGSKITIRQLLQHTSGISNADYPMADTSEGFYRTQFNPTPAEQIVADAVRHPPLFEPGTGWSYANTGYVVVGMIIEKATGRPWYEEIGSRIIKPLGLAHTVWPGNSPDLPQPHATAYKRFAPNGPMIDVTRLVNVDASGGLVTTTADLNRFFRALFGGELLPEKQLNEMKQTVATDDGVQQIFPGAKYGLGIMNIPLECGGSYWTNSGSDPGWGNDNGITEDARQSVVTTWSTEDVTDPAKAKQQANAFVTITKHALCDKK